MAGVCHAARVRIPGMLRRDPFSGGDCVLFRPHLSSPIKMERTERGQGV
jgi:hypothetical protein